MHFLITWTTYGYWLPGDPRGFRTFGAKEIIAPPARYAAENEQHYDPRSYKHFHNHFKSKVAQPVRLNKRHMRAAVKVIADVAARLARTGIIAVAPYHVHVLTDLLDNVTTGRFCNRVKSKSSLRLSDYGLKGKVWARRYHAIRIDKQDIQQAHRYVSSHAEHNAIVHQF